MKKIFFISLITLSACSSQPEIKYASENVISIGRDTLSPLDTPTIQMIDMAAQHCSKYGKNATPLGGGDTLESLTTSELYSWQCTGY